MLNLRFGAVINVTFWCDYRVIPQLSAITPLRQLPTGGAAALRTTLTDPESCTSQPPVLHLRLSRLTLERWRVL